MSAIRRRESKNRRIQQRNEKIGKVTNEDSNSTVDQNEKAN